MPFFAFQLFERLQIVKQKEGGDANDCKSKRTTSNLIDTNSSLKQSLGHLMSGVQSACPYLYYKQF